MSDTVLKVENVSKKYELGLIGSGSLRETISENWKGIFGKKPSKLETESNIFWALSDISFNLIEGDVLGVIGRNGAGKSTLLKVISKITEPSSGRIEIKGRIASLLEVGTGFHPELTGRENVFLNGGILGMSRTEIRKKFDEIVEFSGVSKFIDTPVKRYSSGMYVRLAFSVAAHLEPEILVVDEVLSVGDAEFQKKCLTKMNEVSGSGRTILFVSHNMGAIQSLCNKAILLNGGKMINQGGTEEMINQYLSNGVEDQGQRKIDTTKPFYINKIDILNSEGKQISEVLTGGNYDFRISVNSKVPIKKMMVRVEFLDIWGNILFTCNNNHQNIYFTKIAKDGSVYLRINKLPLNQGRYFVNVLCKANEELADNYINAIELTVQQGDFFGTGKLPSKKQGMLIEHSWRT